MSTGPYTDHFESDVLGYSRRKTWYRQKPPFVKPLPYWHGEYLGRFTDYNTGVKSGFLDRRYSGTPYYIGTQGVYPRFDDAYRKAYDRFRNLARRPQAKLGTTIVEVRESFDMIHSRTLSLLRSFRAMRKGDVGGLIRELKLTGDGATRAHSVWKNRGSKAAVSSANHYLEYIFGWKPMIEDIASAVKVLQSDFPFKPVKARGKIQWTSENVETPPWGYVLSRQTTLMRCQISANVQITNPNLALANDLGFVNPAAIAFEVIPGSFLLNWFVPVGRFLESWTDWVGYSLSDIAVTRSSTANRFWEQWNPGNLHGNVEDECRVVDRRLEPSLWPPAMQWFKLPGADAARERSTSVVALAIQAFSPRR